MDPPAGIGDSARVAVYTLINEETARAVVAAVAPTTRLSALVPLAQGSINTTYRIERGQAAPLFLRINEGKSRATVAREVRLVLALSRARLPVVTPRILPGPAGPILELAVDGGRLALVFEALPGEDLTRSAVTSEHARQVGAFLGAAHVALHDVSGSLPNRYGCSTVQAWLQSLVGTRVLASEVAQAVKRLARTHAELQRRRAPLPRSVIHGDLFIDNTKWADGTLAAVFDWEMAGRDACMRDLGTTLLAWAPAVGGDVAAALVEGYARVRPLRPSERRGLFLESMLAAIRFTVSRIRDFEVRTAGDRAFLDYREFLTRLDALEGLGNKAFLRGVGIG